LGWIPFATPVIAAKAGIQPLGRAFLRVCEVDSRSPAFAEDKLRGNDEDDDR
jgi:hypothetical protein